MPSGNEWVFDVTESEFDEKVVKKSNDLPVVVDFWAPWCGPCQELAPILERMVAERAGSVLLAKVNTDAEQNLAGQFGIAGIPFVLAYRKGRPVLQFEGLLPDAQLTEFFERLKPTEAELNIETAMAIEKSNPAQAEQKYRLALKNEPNQELAIVGLARVLIQQQNESEAADLLERIGPHGEFGAEAEKLRAMLWLREKTKELPDEEALQKKVHANPNDAQALFQLGCVRAAGGKTTEALENLYQAGLLDRKLVAKDVKETMVKIFFIVGARSELADTYRDKLTSLLY
ncbi:MAG: tetratricopeptide repeat protein [Planctomycetes bacterium]|nr:tetratricopeptide repeat protein [Planctomycetota bacterium]